MRPALILLSGAIAISFLPAAKGARSFEAVTNSGLPNVSRYPALRSADIDNDYDDDIVLAGYLGSAAWSGGIYRSNGDGTFTNIGVSILEVDYADAAWGDYDNDGDPDLALGGTGASGSHGVEIYRNEAGTTFTDINAGLRNAGKIALSWGDPENDGFLDLALSGGYFSISKYFDFNHNRDGTNGFTRKESTGPVPIIVGAMAFCDVNKDGRDDIINTGEAGSGSLRFTSYLYYGTGNTNLPFTGGPNVFQGVNYSSVDWADFNDDTYPDLLLTGATNDFLHGCTAIYQNQEGTGFVRFVTSHIPGVSRGAGRWGDYDNDGDPDILLVGYTEDTNEFAEIYRNDGGTNFVAIEAGLVGMLDCEAAWCDFNNDDYPDIIMAGTTTNIDDTYQTLVYLNTAGPVIDTDGDGIPDDAETNTGTYNGPNDTGTDPNNPDSDGDGTDDGNEIVTGNDPTDSSERFGPTGLTSGSSPFAPVITWNSVTTCLYLVHSSSPIAGTWSNVYQVMGTGESLSYTNHPEGKGSGFLYLEADPQ